MTRRRDALVRRALLGNALFSTLCALVAFAAAPALAEVMGLPEATELYVVGVSLVPFAVGLAVIATRRAVPIVPVLGASVLDALWVLSSTVLLVGWPDLLTSVGEAIVIAIATAVATFGLLQVQGVRATVRNPDPAGPRARVQFARDVNASVEDAWAVVADFDAYADYAPTLTFSRVLSGTAEGTVRACGDAKGQWTERCDLWEPGRGFGFVVDTESDDYPHPFRALRGRWRVEPRVHGARVSMVFEMTLPGGVLGDLAVAAMGDQARDGIEGLLDNFQRAIEGRAPARAA